MYPNGEGFGSRKAFGYAKDRFRPGDNPTERWNVENMSKKKNWCSLSPDWLWVPFCGWMPIGLLACKFHDEAYADLDEAREAVKKDRLKADRELRERIERMADHDVIKRLSPWRRKVARAWIKVWAAVYYAGVRLCGAIAVLR